jgi:hypothetical protein
MNGAWLTSAVRPELRERLKKFERSWKVVAAAAETPFIGRLDLLMLLWT